MFVEYIPVSDLMEVSGNNLSSRDISTYNFRMKGTNFGKFNNSWIFRKLSQDFPFKSNWKYILSKYLVLAKLSTMSICKHTCNHGIDTRLREKLHSVHSIYINKCFFFCRFRGLRWQSQSSHGNLGQWECCCFEEWFLQVSDATNKGWSSKLGWKHCTS